MPWTDNNTDTNYYPTAWSWTNGTSSGPTARLTGTGMSAVSISAIPSASSSQSGIITTGTQTISGNKTFSGNCYATSPGSSDDSTRIATTAWVRDLVVTDGLEIYACTIDYNNSSGGMRQGSYVSFILFTKISDATPTLSNFLKWIPTRHYVASGNILTQNNNYITVVGIERSSWGSYIIRAVNSGNEHTTYTCYTYSVSSSTTTDRDNSTFGATLIGRLYGVNVYALNQSINQAS